VRALCPYRELQHAFVFIEITQTIDELRILFVIRFESKTFIHRISFYIVARLILGIYSTPGASALGVLSFLEHGNQPLETRILPCLNNEQSLP
jgi:hypothetical protein